MTQTIGTLSAPQGMQEWQWILIQVQLLLIKGGYKQATTLYMEDGAPGTRSALDRLSKQLVAQGFCCRLSDQEEGRGYNLHIANDSHSLDRLELCLSGTLDVNQADLIHGQLSGFPNSAIAAFIANEVIDPEELSQRVRVSAEYAFASFRLSKDHWQEELATGKIWAQYIKNNAPELYKKYLTQFSEP